MQANIQPQIPPGNWYQEATINGVSVPQRRTQDTSELRWQNLVKPLIQKDSGVCTDLGCNAGFYSRKMADLGFTAIGAEKSPEFLAHARYWESMEPKGVRIVDADINEYNLQCSSIVLLCQVHYWLEPSLVTALVEKIKGKAIDVIVVGKHKALKPMHPMFGNMPNARVHKSPCDMESLRAIFSDWDEIDHTSGEKHYSILFRNRYLFKKGVNDIGPEKNTTTTMLYSSFGEFVNLVLSGNDFDPKTREYYKYLTWRGFKNKDDLIKRHTDLIKSIREDGIKEPLTLIDDTVYDGHHRLIIARKLKLEKVICRNKENAHIRLRVTR